MSGKITQKQNSKEAQHKKDGKTQKTKGTRPKTLPGLPTRQGPKRCKKISSPIVLDGFFLKKIQIFSLAS